LAPNPLLQDGVDARALSAAVAAFEGEEEEGTVFEASDFDDVVAVFAPGGSLS